ncbi:hypothetical protein BDP27DRAFT_1371006 [Rhodocollybia butyracea]|uniref:Uncharacterized protein n=1 Tax=Rhodocollybia butyracea TaxID=206335 RepID=A0A9P5P9T4_9AGAR|nr:hypothetical protein BDP27DRAFT_1371006 [Rhodocollybia butyracea]
MASMRLLKTGLKVRRHKEERQALRQWAKLRASGTNRYRYKKRKFKQLRPTPRCYLPHSNLPRTRPKPHANGTNHFLEKNRKTNSSSDAGSTRSSRDSGPSESIQATRSVPGAQNIENSITPNTLNNPNALHVAGAAVEKGLVVLKEIADLVPVVPAGVGSALGVVSKCIQIYHQVSKNKERTEALAKDLASKVKDVKEYRNEQSGSSETDKIFEGLASELEKINIKAVPQKYETWTSKILGHIQHVVQADVLSQEIDQYFQDISNAFKACELVKMTYLAPNAEKIFVAH